MPTLVEQLARKHLGGDLAPDAAAMLASIDNEHPEIQGWVRRMFLQLEQAAARPQDFSLGMAWGVATVIPQSLPHVWGGMVQPISFPGRHAHLDDYLTMNPWRSLRAGDALLDVGCGFPPFTTIELANRFPDCTVRGIDVAFAQHLVYDAAGDYACFGADGVLRYFQYGARSPERMNALNRDRDATVARFAALKSQLEPLLGPGDGFAEASSFGARIVRDPLGACATPNLDFREAGVGDPHIGPVDFVRCQNVLRWFDLDWRNKARQWFLQILRPGGILMHGMNLPSTDSLYVLWQRDGDTLVPREFALSLDHLRPTSAAVWWTMYEDDDEARTRAAVLHALWEGNDTFRAEFDAALDGILAALDYQSRRPDGFLGAMPVGWSPEQLTAVRIAINDQLDAGGWAERAAEALRKRGYHAWRNAVGDLSVDPLEWGWDPLTDHGETF